MNIEKILFFYMFSFAAVSCIAGCNAGCYCAEGFVRNNDGICVIPETCPPIDQCSVNEVWDDCGPADGCEASCDNPDLLNVACVSMCVPKCICKEGYIRGPDGICVDSCPTGIIFESSKSYISKVLVKILEECFGENEVYTSCGSGCGDLTCEVWFYEISINILKKLKLCFTRRQASLLLAALLSVTKVAFVLKDLSENFQENVSKKLNAQHARKRNVIHNVVLPVLELVQIKIHLFALLSALLGVYVRPDWSEM